MITFAVRVNERKVRGDLIQFREYLGVTVGNILKQEGCLTARAALKYAPPLVVGGGKGDTPEAGRTGAKAINKDVRSVFAAPGTTLSSVFANAGMSPRAAFNVWRNRPLGNVSSLSKRIHSDGDADRAFRKAANLYQDKPSLSKPINNAGQMRLIHEGQRKDGRIVRAGGPSKEIKRHPFIAKESLIRQYVNKRALEVGKLKAGWWAVIDRHGRGLNIVGRIVDAGAKGLPKYITRHRFTGTMSLQLSGNSKKMSIVNPIGDNDQAGTRASTFNLVVAHRLAALSKRPYQDYANRIVRNWNNGQAPSAG